MTKTKARRTVSRPDLPEVSQSRSIPQGTRQELIAVAAGRCEFRGCGKFLFAHEVTKTGGYFGNHAHIRAFSSGGPRAGETDERIGVDLHDLENLMLLCHACHVLVDTHCADYPIADLRESKRLHEERVAYLLELPTENEASVIEIWTSVADPPVVRSAAKLVAALLPLYPSQRRRCVIDFAGLNLSDPALLPAAIERIDQEVGQMFSARGERPAHVAIFGITNIPLLVHVGARLGDRQDVLLFQYHRDTKDWKWKHEQPRAQFGTRLLQQGTDRSRVAAVVALSGTIDMAALPAELDASYSVYEITLTSEVPHTGFLRTKGDLDRFRDHYRRFLAQLQVDHGSLEEVVVIPAVPIPAAISLGMDRLPKVAPALAVYDLDQNQPGARSYRRVLRVD